MPCCHREITNRLKVAGKYVAAPADLHCGNWTFANTKLLRAATSTCRKAGTR